jgi:hypothetical protein
VPRAEAEADPRGYGAHAGGRGTHTAPGSADTAAAPFRSAPAARASAPRPLAAARRPPLARAAPTPPPRQRPHPQQRSPGGAPPAQGSRGLEPALPPKGARRCFPSPANPSAPELSVPPLRAPSGPRTPGTDLIYDGGAASTGLAWRGEVRWDATTRGAQRLSDRGSRDG